MRKLVKMAAVRCVTIIPVILVFTLKQIKPFEKVQKCRIDVIDEWAMHPYLSPNLTIIVALKRSCFIKKDDVNGS